MPRQTSIIAISIGLACIAPNALLAEEKAHVHGQGQLNLAIDGKELEIELIAPGADIVGFEHDAKSDDDKAAVQAAVAKLKDVAVVLGIPDAAKCTLEEAEIESALLEDQDHDDHAHKDEDGHKHDDHDDHAHKDDDGHKHDDHDDHAHKDEHDHGDHKDEHAHEEEGEQHAEFHAHYHFDCGAPSELTHLDLGYFKQFPNAAELDVQAITASGQISVELTAEKARLDLE